MADQHKIVCFGELLLRLNAPGRERLLQSRKLEVHIGGAEANVAVSLAQFGLEAAMASIVAANALGDAALGELRRYGVDVSACQRRAGRMGLYFMTAGAVRRPSEILYDRAGSAFAEAEADAIDWPIILHDAAWLHLSGVTPAVGPKAAAAAMRAAKSAGAAGVKVSFDGNYRGQMWAAWKGDGPGVLREILSRTTLAFINERDIGLILGKSYAGDEEDARQAAFADAFAAFPSLQSIAATSRRQQSVDHHRLSAIMVTRGGEWRSGEYELAGVVDRIGAGDAFAAGILHALAAGRNEQFGIDFAAAAAAFKHSVPGDFNIASADEIEQAMAATSFDVRR